MTMTTAMNSISEAISKLPRPVFAGGHTPVALQLSDLHFSTTPLWQGQPELRGDREFALEYFLYTAQLLDVPLIFCGDIFNTKTMDPVSLVTFFSICKKYPHVNKLFIQGNHDRGSASYCDLKTDDHWARLVPDRKTTVPSGLTIVGVDCQPTDRIIQELEKVDKTADILVIHQTVLQLFGLEGVWTLDLTKMPRNTLKIPIILAGDVHNSTVMLLGENRFLSMGGTPYVWRLDEINKEHKMPFVVRVPEGKLAIHSVPLPSRWFYRMDISNEVSRDAFPEFVKNSVSCWEQEYPSIAGLLRPAFVVEYQEDIPNVHEVVLRACVDNGCFLFDKPVVLTKVEREALPVDPFEGFSTEACLRNVAPTLLEGKDEKYVNRVCDATLRLLNGKANLEAALIELRGALAME